MAVPKRRTSKARRDQRRAHDKLVIKGLTRCPDCGEMKRSHRVCKNCGSYKGETVVENG
ncbi:50S ribosomal protein L32 [Aliibacillus thermotolerans]|uniref:Large ribosomal subunit protein bL32 n=1 Tax=Aliibacillus thermotolerans TaxID=1834418 RepID=A0ABW0U3U9_9BACI|nr:50S ribosomal protein L32 [Aliibacillus thermotolerans]MDA3131017.1 50S ribosomal protein L32 [Aliibacillus thermotolerans]